MDGAIFVRMKRVGLVLFTVRSITIFCSVTLQCLVCHCHWLVVMLSHGKHPVRIHAV